MPFEWDADKAHRNLLKHGVRFSDALFVLEDERALTLRDASEEEDRWVTVGSDLAGRVLVVVYTWRGEKIRIISARHATPRETKQYEKGSDA